ncbi:MAG: hypothetical protein ACJ74O_05825 [Frankiaceae bacterium]
MPGRRSTAAPLALPLAGALLALAACSHQPVTRAVADPPAERFSAGACRAAAPAILEIGRTARDVLRGRSSSAGAVEALTKGQQALRTALQHAGPAQRRSVQPLVTAIGVYRIRALSDTVSQPVTAAVASAQHRLVLHCVPGGGQ